MASIVGIITVIVLAGKAEDSVREPKDAMDGMESELWEPQPSRTEQ